MTLFGLSLVLAAAFCHASWNFFVKRINGGAELVWLFSTIASAVYVPIVLYVLLIEKPDIGMEELFFIIGSSLIHLGYFLLLQRGYRIGDLSLVYPTARATGPVLSTVFAVIFLGEHVTLQSLAGTAIIIFGVLCLTGGLKAGKAHMAHSLLFGLGAGLLIGSYTAWDAYTVSMLAVPPLILDFATTVARFFLLAPVAYRKRADVKRHWRDHKAAVIYVAITSSLSYLLVLYAMTFTPIIYVAPLRETSVLLAVLAGSILLGEGHLKQRLIWSCVILTGVSLLATA